MRRAGLAVLLFSVPAIVGAQASPKPAPRLFAHPDPIGGPSSLPPPQPLGTCAALARDYDYASRVMASTLAEGLADDSAPRATLRELRDLNQLQAAQIDLGLMRDNHCPLPKSAPNATEYLTPALACRAAQRSTSGSEQPVACRMSEWTKHTGG